MGRIKQRFIKNQAGELLKAHDKKFSKDFDNNKEVLKELDIIESRSTRNKIAGYIVRLIRKRKF